MRIGLIAVIVLAIAVGFIDVALLWAAIRGPELGVYVRHGAEMVFLPDPWIWHEGPSLAVPAILNLALVVIVFRLWHRRRRPRC